MPPFISDAGPSKRIANFTTSSDEEDVEVTPRARKQAKINGHGGRKEINGKLAGQGGKSKEGSGSGSGKQKEKERRERAEVLLGVRQELPFYQGRKAILEEIMAHETTIILGETGCGKSTQLPQLLRTHRISRSKYPPSSTSNSASSSAGPSIAVTQPRRLPCLALARRVSEEMGCECGREVGYSVRFEEAMSADTRVRYLTEGVMMRELANGSGHGKPKPTAKANGHVNGHVNGNGNGHSNGQEASEEQELNLLLKYDIIIIDEAHERTLNTDFLCGALKKIQRIRKNSHERGQSVGVNGKKIKVKPLKLVIMSATLDPTKFRNFFETGRDSLLVKGRMYNVATRHVVDPVDDFIESAANKVMQIHCAVPPIKGDVLVFMPGSDEIETCVELLKRAAKELPHEALDILPLYAGLPSAAQNKIFAPLPPQTRRIVVSTNIAETSITIPGIVFVIDSGYKKEKEYVHRTSGAIDQLRKRPVSKAAAWQRTGRAGRERDGECFRLFTKEAFDDLVDFDAPEIQRCNLSSAVLQLVAMNQDPFTFEYIDNPGRDAIGAAFQTLAGLGALSGPRTITSLGLEMLKYPLDPPHARILISSFDLGCPSEIIDILSIVNSGPLFIDRAADRESAATSRTKFIHRDGDHLTQLNVLRAYLAIRDQDRGSVSQWLKENHVNGKTIQHALKVREQLAELAVREGKDPKVSCGSETDCVARCLLRGLFMNTAIVQSDGSYRQTAGSLIVKIHPSSVLMSKKVPAILYDELTITSAIYARNVSAFDQHWLTEIPWFQQAGTSVPTPADKTKL